MRALIDGLAGKTHVLWDWNGTLLDDLAMSVAVVSEVCELHGLPRLELGVYLETFRFPIRDYYRELGFDFERTPFPMLSRQFIERYAARLGETKLHDGAIEALEALRERGIGCSVLSAAHERDLEELLVRHGIRRYFTHVYGLGHHEANSKIERGRELLAALRVPPAELVLVGDTDHDLEVAEALGIDALLVTGGHQSETRLRRLHDWVVSR